jgi:hypothetical protein
MFTIVVDITVYHDGFHGDLNETLLVGKVDEDSQKLVNVAYECMMAGISIGMYVLYTIVNVKYCTWYMVIDCMDVCSCVYKAPNMHLL